MKTLALLFGTILLAATATAQPPATYPVIGEIVRDDPRLEALIPSDAKIEVIASGFDWTEGPLWFPDDQGDRLLFCDIPQNTIYAWRPESGVELFMKPSGYTGIVDYGAEPGSNGLLLDHEGRLVCCEHGDRRLSVLTKDGGKLTLVDRYEGKRLNSPNDGTLKSNGDIYFTDPPYGLPERENDSRRELDFFGVYRIATDGTLTLLTKEMTRPNGIAFSPDEKTLYVAQSDPAAAVWMSFPVKEDGMLDEGTLFYDATDNVGKLPGLPDGMEVDAKGNLFATGPGGVYVFTPEGDLLGRISTGERTSNVAWGNDGILYLTADMYVCRIQTSTGK